PYQPTYQPVAYAPPPGYGPPPPGPQTAAVGSRVAGGVKIRVIPLIGAVAVAVASALPWVSSIQGSASENGFKVPFKFLFDFKSQSGGGFKVGIALILLGVIGGLLTFVPVSGIIRRLLGVGAIAIGGAYIAQLVKLVHDLGGGISVTRVLGFGVYVAIGGGVLLTAGR